jgi:glycogen synthase
MKLLLVGPYPPPHGGVSVHIAETKRRASLLGIPCRVLNTDRNAEGSPHYIPVRRASGFVLSLIQHSLRGWTIHVHTNGHNMKSWLVAMVGGFAGRLGPGSALTLHSGKMPEYVGAKWSRQWLARITCRTFKEITCVSSRLRQTVEGLGVPAPRIKVSPAFSGVTDLSHEWTLSPSFEKWFSRHDHVFSAAASNRPEYGNELLVEAVARVVKTHNNTGCLLIGLGEDAKEIRQLIEERNLSRSVLMLGDVPHEQCLHLISRSAAFIRPTFTDGDSLSVREALALRVPVIASDAATRPQGTVLFQTGNVEDLTRKLECVLEGSLQNSAR